MRTKQQVKRNEPVMWERVRFVVDVYYKDSGAFKEMKEFLDDIENLIEFEE